MDLPQKRPTMFILVGPNGAGKSTLYETVIKPKIKAPFINADHIQKEELADPSMSASYRAAQIAEDRRREHLQEKSAFVSESTFSHPSKLELIDDAKLAGFRVLIFHINVGDVELAVARVTARVGEGGHDVPEDKIKERYKRNQYLIKQAVLKADQAFIYDNSTLNEPPLLAVAFVNGRISKTSHHLPPWVKELYGRELDQFPQPKNQEDQ